jgi:cysteine desulfurase
MRKIYLDNASTTPVDKKVLKEMIPYFSEKFGNPSSFHDFGLEAKTALENARKRVANILNCKPEEIIFTGSGTESINLALIGIAHANSNKGKHLITSKIEHHAVLNSCKFLESEGYSITYLDVDKEGFIDLGQLSKSIREDTILISVMYANNEIGTIEPIEKIGKIARDRGVYFHTDACQAGSMNLDVQELNIDLMSLNGEKIYGPKGTGILYIRNGVKINPIIYGGGQEKEIRSGTENVAGIVGFAKALEESQKKNKISKLRDELINGLLKIEKTRLNGPRKNRLTNNVNISFLDVEGESVILRLNQEGIYVSTGSACNSKKLEGSHVLKAIGLPYEAIHGSIRFSLGKDTTSRDIKFVIKTMKKIVGDLRELSPIKLNEVYFK